MCVHNTKSLSKKNKKYDLRFYFEISDKICIYGHLGRFKSINLL